MIRQLSLTDKERMGISQVATSSSGFNQSLLEKVLKKANLLSAAEYQDPEKISNETLWHIFNMYKIEKGLQKEQEVIDKRKNAYMSYHRELKDQLHEN
jgi:hypothetical protein